MSYQKNEIAPPTLIYLGVNWKYPPESELTLSGLGEMPIGSVADMGDTIFLPGLMRENNQIYIGADMGSEDSHQQEQKY